MNAALLPEAFPLRREVEFAAAIREDPGSTCYYDTLWLDPHKVAFLAVCLPAGGLQGAVAAAALKQVLRATLTELGDPAACLAASENVEGAEAIDAATVTLDLRQGSATAAVMANGIVTDGNGGMVPAGTFSIAPDAVLIMRAGGVPAAPAAGEAGTVTPSEFARQALAGATGAAVAAAILFKGTTRPPGVETATLSNDLSEVPALLDRLDRFCDHHRIDRQAIAGLDVALDEILTNLISYAFRDGARHIIDVEFAVADGCLSIEVRDAGAAFNPLKVPPPNMSEDINAREIGGLGMHFVRTVTDEITYRREAGWNILHLKKALKMRDEEGVDIQ